LRHHPHNAKAWYYLGLFYQQHSQQQPNTAASTRHVAKAVAALHQACALAPQHTAAQWALGQLLQQQGQWVAAQNAYWRAWHSPGVQGNKLLQRQVAHQLALLLEAHQQADPQAAEDFALMLALTLKRGCEGAHGTLATHSHLAKLALAQGNQQEGNQQGQQALGLWHCHQGLRHQPQHLQALLNVAHTAQQAQLPQQAIFYYHRALATLQAQALMGNTGSATALRASLYLALGELYATPTVKQPHRALAYLQQAVALDATQPKAYLRLGQAYQQLQQPAQALEALSQAKALHQATTLGAGVVIEGVGLSPSAAGPLATEEAEALNHALSQLFGQF
jgi:tetratricopeptide (TPR) repeat protein